MRSLHIPLILLSLAVSASLPAQTGQTPAINEPYKVKQLDVQEWVQRFEVEGREAFDLRQEIVAAMNLRPGQVIADVGAGTGLFEPLLANEVGPQGKVYAIDIVPRFIEHIDNKAQRAGLSQIKTVLSTERSIGLPANSVDVAFACDAYHHFVYYDAMLASIRRALKPGGRLFIVDFDKESKTLSPSMAEHVGQTKGEFTRQITAAGFKFDEDLTLPQMKTNFMYRFVKVAEQ
jgi:ubiquinone/menaquinone biosynthesis C-methylase UbiE